MTTALWPRNALEVTDREGALLRDAASRVPKEHAIVEIGSYRGRSTCFLAAGSAVGNRARIYAIDLWTDGTGLAENVGPELLERPYAEPETRAAFDEAVAEHGHGIVMPIQGASKEIAAGFGIPIGLLFVDGSHAPRDVAADIGAWCPKVVPGGMVLFHDYQAEYVKRTVLDSLPLTDWLDEPGVERIGVFRRRP